ncbi:MAG: ATP-dependent DNA helicase RecG [Collinsella sp.]|nr:ATP-dependent DNA helicase RecG [Collinsella sp.]
MASVSHGCDMPLAADRLARAGVLARDVRRLRYVNDARAEALARLRIATVRDLLMHIPRRYLDFSRAHTIEAAPLGQVATIVATVDRVVEKRPRPRMVVTEVHLVDETGVLKAAFFKQPWLSRQLAPGDRLALIGKVEFAYGFKQISGPTFERLDEGTRTGSILPVHPASEGISAAWMRRIVSGALEAAGSVPDPVPARLRARRRLMGEARALRSIHFPRAMAEVGEARRRLAYDEVLYLQLALRLRNESGLVDVRAHAHAVGERVAALRAALPFSLSGEQEAAVEDILGDMASSERVMNRLLLGDVGTGKTAVAAVALAAVADTGTQACVMAPTGVLAQQYTKSAGPLLTAAGIPWALLTGATPAAERARILAALAAGEITVLIGTHAVLSDDVAFRALTFVVIDEQHRFGVGQRTTLRAKGPGADLLVMTATPIPRTLALSVFGDLDTSVIRHRPVAGAGVTTRMLADENRDIAYGALRDALATGRQAYVICPLVSPKDDEAELEDVPGLERDDEGRPASAPPLVAATAEVEHMRQILPEATVGLLHGRMPDAEKTRVIEAFRGGEIDVLVSTTVVEVGVDVPNATVMVIENGERFGLATLHQLRGRVGRGSLAGTCFIISAAAGGRGRRSPAWERLEALERTADGFELAEQDLRLRHEGEILGFRQSGGVSLRFVDLAGDAELVEAAHEDAVELLRGAPHLRSRSTLPLRHEVIDRFGARFLEVSGA